MTMTTQTHFTVEQASRWLTCAQPVPLPLLQRLGKACSLVCRIRGATFVDVPVQGKNWPTERGYPAAILQEVFLANPDTRPFVPGVATTSQQVAASSLQPAAPAPAPKPAPVVYPPPLAAIVFALETTEGLEFLRAWMCGDWDVIRREWPDAPSSVFVSAGAA